MDLLHRSSSMTAGGPRLCLCLGNRSKVLTHQSSQGLEKGGKHSAGQREGPCPSLMALSNPGGGRDELLQEDAVHWKYNLSSSGCSVEEECTTLYTHFKICWSGARKHLHICAFVCASCICHCAQIFCSFNPTFSNKCGKHCFSSILGLINYSLI